MAQEGERDYSKRRQREEEPAAAADDNTECPAQAEVREGRLGRHH